MLHELTTTALALSPDLALGRQEAKQAGSALAQWRGREQTGRLRHGVSLAVVCVTVIFLDNPVCSCLSGSQSSVIPLKEPKAS